MMRVSLKSIFIFILMFLVAGCTQSDTSVESHHVENTNILKYDVSAPFATLNPGVLNAAGSTHIFPLLFSYLFVPDENENLQPDLAVNWSYDVDNCKWIINLRQGVLFHNGQPFTSKDVEYSLGTILAETQPSLFSCIRKIYLPAENIIHIVLKKTDPEFLKKIWTIEIISKDSGPIADIDHPIGTGPFKFEYKKGNSRVFLSANEDYFFGRPILDGVSFFYQPDKEKSWTRLISGQTDIAQEISPKNYQMIRSYENRFYFNHYIMNFYSILLYNNQDPLFSDQNVRMALSYAINKAYIVDNILKGYGKVAAGPMGINSLYHNPEVLPVPYKPQKAIDLLQQAGWHYDRKMNCRYKDGKCFEFNMFVFKEYQIEKKVAQYIKLCLNDIGIKVRIQTVPYNELVKKYRGNTEFQAVLTEFTSAYRCPENVYDLWADNPEIKSNICWFENQEVTKLLNRALEEENLLIKKNLMFKVDKMIHDLQPGSFLYHKTAIDVMSRRFSLLGPFSLTYEGIYQLQFAKLRDS